MPKSRFLFRFWLRKIQLNWIHSVAGDDCLNRIRRNNACMCNIYIYIQLVFDGALGSVWLCHIYALFIKDVTGRPLAATDAHHDWLHHLASFVCAAVLEPKKIITIQYRRIVAFENSLPFHFRCTSSEKQPNFIRPKSQQVEISTTIDACIAFDCSKARRWRADALGHCGENVFWELISRALTMTS